MASFTNLDSNRWPICTLVRQRQCDSSLSSLAFQRRVAKFLKGDKELLMDPEIVSPHTQSISSLAVDKHMGRFVLAGSKDATISVYDLSFWGSEGFSHQTKNGQSRRRFRPVARSIRVPWGRMVSNNNNNSNDYHHPSALEVPTGHAAAIRHVQWYPVDTGVFTSYAADGSLLLWDTNRMEPVLHVTPFAESLEDEHASAAGGPAHWQPNGDHNLIATGSWLDSNLKLVDVRSGASSHQLIGHARGITAVQWSPTIPVVVASGSRDGTIRLWDIRKSGSHACISVLARDMPYHDPSRVMHPSYQADYSHLRKFAAMIEKQKRLQHKKRKLGTLMTTTTTTTTTAKQGSGMAVAPNNYQHVQRQMVRSHHGHVAAMAFLSGGQQLASIGGVDGELVLWDLRHGPTLLERKFVSPGGMSAATPNQRQAALCVHAENDTIWVGHQSHIMGYSIEGGSPQQVLRGHLTNVTCLDRIAPEMTLLSGSNDGMILTWGKPKGALFRTRQAVRTEDKDNW